MHEPLFDGGLERVATGFGFTEGPAWGGDALFFSDIPNRITHRLDEDGRCAPWRTDNGGGNGLYFDRDGTLLTCEKHARRVSRVHPDGRVEPVADRFAGRRLNSPNDVIVDARGRVYFTDPRFGAMDDVEQDAQAVYRVARDGAITRVIDDLARPNGLVLSRDGRRLFVDDSDHAHVRVYDLGPDDRVGPGATFAVLAGLADGMTIDEDERLYVAGDGLWIFDRAGQRLDVLALPETPSNCTFGGTDGRTLYITAQRSVYRIRTRAAGVTAWR